MPGDNQNLAIFEVLSGRYEAARRARLPAWHRGLLRLRDATWLAAVLLALLVPWCIGAAHLGGLAVDWWVK